MPTTTLRILHTGPEPLDATSTLSPDLVQTVQRHPTLRIAVLTLPVGVRLGVFEPGLFSIRGGASATLILRSLTLLSAEAPTHAPGCRVSLRPPGFGLVDHDRELLRGSDDLETGLCPLAPRIPCPPGHAYVFDTRADGEQPGPHLLQMTLETAQLPAEMGAHA